MQQDSNIIKFDKNRRFKSRVLSYIVDAVTWTAIVTLLFDFIYFTLAYFGIKSDIFVIQNMYDLLLDLFSFAILAIIFDYGNTKVNLAKKTIQVQDVWTFYLPVQIEIINIYQIEVSQHITNLVIYSKEKRKIALSVKECNKFVKLLQELNPNIEVEYKE